MGRIELQSESYKEGFGDSESAIDSFGMFTWGSAFSAIDELDTDDDGNLTFSTQTIGEFLGLDTDVEAVLDVEVEITAVLGTATMPISQILKLGRGAVVELNQGVSEDIKIHANNRPVATGEVVVIEDKLGVNITETIKMVESAKR